MAYIDTQTRVWASAALTTTAVSTNAYDLGAAFSGSAHGETADPGPGEPLALVVNVETAGTHAGTETYEFQVISATASDLTTGQEILQTTGTIATADVATALAAGKFIIVNVPPFWKAQRYLGAKFVGANSSSVTVSASFKPVSFVQAQHYYATAIVIN